MYVYVESERGDDFTLYTVGFYAPDGKWHAESDHNDRDEAAARVAYLNGSTNFAREEMDRVNTPAPLCPWCSGSMNAEGWCPYCDEEGNDPKPEE